MDDTTPAQQFGPVARANKTFDTAGSIAKTAGKDVANFLNPANHSIADAAGNIISAGEGLAKKPIVKDIAAGLGLLPGGTAIAPVAGALASVLPGSSDNTDAKPAPTAAAKPKVKPATAPQFDLQSWLNQQLAPYNKQMEQSIADASQSMVQPWMPASIRGTVQKFQTLTGKALQGLMPALKAQQQDYVVGQQQQQLLNLLPDALIYHTLAGNALPKVNDPGVQSLWKIFENINSGLPPTNNGNAGIDQFLSQLPSNQQAQNPGGTTLNDPNA